MDRAFQRQLPAVCNALLQLREGLRHLARKFRVCRQHGRQCGRGVRAVQAFQQCVGAFPFVLGLDALDSVAQVLQVFGFGKHQAQAAKRAGVQPAGFTVCQVPCRCLHDLFCLLQHERTAQRLAIAIRRGIECIHRRFAFHGQRGHLRLIQHTAAAETFLYLFRGVRGEVRRQCGVLIGGKAVDTAAADCDTARLGHLPHRVIAANRVIQ